MATQGAETSSHPESIRLAFQEPSTMISVLWPTPRVITSALWGFTGTKSFAITVMVWLSMVNLCMPSAPALISRRQCLFPDWNLNLDTPGIGRTAGTVGKGTIMSSSFAPLMRLLSELGNLDFPSDGLDNLVVLRVKVN